MQININDFFNMAGGSFGSGGFGFNSGYQREWTVQIWLDGHIVQNDKHSFNDFMAGQQFRQMVQQIGNDSRPMKVRFSYIYYSPREDEENYVEFTNSHWDKVKDRYESENN